MHPFTNRTLQKKSLEMHFAVRCISFWYLMSSVHIPVVHLKILGLTNHLEIVLYLEIWCTKCGFPDNSHLQIMKEQKQYLTFKLESKETAWFSTHIICLDKMHSPGNKYPVMEKMSLPKKAFIIHTWLLK